MGTRVPRERQKAGTPASPHRCARVGSGPWSPRPARSAGGLQGVGVLSQSRVQSAWLSAQWDRVRDQRPGPSGELICPRGNKGDTVRPDDHSWKRPLTRGSGPPWLRPGHTTPRPRPRALSSSATGSQPLSAPPALPSDRALPRQPALARRRTPPPSLGVLLRSGERGPSPEPAAPDPSYSISLFFFALSFPFPGGLVCPLLFLSVSFLY